MVRLWCFARAFAATLCTGENPTEMHYDENAMWEELIPNLNNSEMFPFGINDSNQTVKYKRMRTIREGIFCTCMRLDDGKKVTLEFVKNGSIKACVVRIPKFYCSFCRRTFDERKVAASKEGSYFAEVQEALRYP